MELQDLRSNWQNAGDTFKSETDLQKMTKISRLPAIKKIRVKLIVETISLGFFLFIYYDWFDGDKKPFMANALLVGSMLLYILNDVIGYRSIWKPVSGQNLKLSIHKYLSTVKKLSAYSLVISFLYSTCIILFFTSVIHFTNAKKILLVGIIVVLVVSVFLSYKAWVKWISQLRQQLKELDVDNEK